jgi:hypothetical protein
MDGLCLIFRPNSAGTLLFYRSPAMGRAGMPEDER